MNNQNICPKCGNPKKPWFKLCFECNEKENQRPTCDICGKEVQEGHYLCIEHWKEKQEEKNNLKKIDYVKTKKEEEFKEKFEGKFLYNSQKVKSKSELLICYFLNLNGILFSYERTLYLDIKEYKPDFVIDDDKGNTIIIEHKRPESENF